MRPRSFALKAPEGGKREMEKRPSKDSRRVVKNRRIRATETLQGYERYPLTQW